MQPSTGDRYTAVALDLMRQSGQTGAATRLSVTGTSMVPLLRPGDAVWLQAVAPATLRSGDLALIRQQSVLLTHRLIAVGAEGWQTKGDNNRLADPPVAAQAIEGRIIALERGGRSIDLRHHPWPAVNQLLCRMSRLEHRLQKLLHPESHRLAYIVDSPFKLLMRAIVVVAIRL